MGMRRDYGYYHRRESTDNYNPSSETLPMTSKPNKSALKETFSPAALLREVLSQRPRGIPFTLTSGSSFPGSYRLPSDPPRRISYDDDGSHDPMDPPPMTLADMSAMMAVIERHTRPKEANNKADYTGARVLIMLLGEECFRLRASRNVNITTFCTQFNTRFGNL